MNQESESTQVNVNPNPVSETTVSPVSTETTATVASPVETESQTNTLQFKEAMSRVTVTDASGKQRRAKQEDVAQAITKIYAREEFQWLKSNGKKASKPEAKVVKRPYVSKQCNGNMPLSPKFAKAFSVWAQENGVEATFVVNQKNK